MMAAWTHTLCVRRHHLNPRSVARHARGKAIVILAPHPDDETLGCGLLIHELVRTGAKVAVVILTDGQASHPGSRKWPPAALGKLRRGEARRALARLGARDATLRFMGWGDGRLGEDGNVLRLRRLLSEVDAGIVLATSPDDFHPDHQATWQLTVAATRGSKARVVSYAVWSRLGATGFVRARNPGLGAKRWAMNAHRSQITDFIADADGGFTFERGPLDRLVQSEEKIVEETSVSRVRRTL
jgi:LmbE family N-acetylglucosaminyl deacetylase